MGPAMFPLARQVRVHIYSDPNADRHAHGDEAAGGNWEITELLSGYLT